MDSVAEHPEPIVAEVASADIERRVAALEKSVTDLQDTTALEERVYQRVAARIPSSPMQWAGKFNPFRPRATMPPPVESGWLVWDMINEARFLVSMIIDSRFPMTWASRIVLIVCFGLVIAMGWLNPFTWLPFVGPWIDRFSTLLIGFFIFKVLARETQRYRAFLHSIGPPP
jgi:hypothetical protein